MCERAYESGGWKSPTGVQELKFFVNECLTLNVDVLKEKLVKRKKYRHQKFGSAEGGSATLPKIRLWLYGISLAIHRVKVMPD